MMDRESLTRSLELMRRAQHGDREALNRLITRYYGRLRSIVRIRMNPALRRRFDEDDVLQRVFQVVVRTFDRFDVQDEPNLVAWLARIAERQIHDMVDQERARKRDVAREVDTGGSGSAQDSRPGFEPQGPDTLPEVRLERSENKRLLEECLAELEPHYREAILLRDYAELEWADVARELASPSPDAARMLHHKATMELGRLLKRRGLA